MSEKFYEFLKEIRKKQGLTLRRVEKEIGISNAYLSQLENGKILKPSPSILHKLAKYYKISYENIMKLCGYPLPEFEKNSMVPSFKYKNRFQNLTDEEAEKLSEYLEFLRSRRIK